MPKLSLTMIVKNEGAYLEECLCSVKGIADDIVVVDTGSTDKTVEIAEKHGARIFNFNWIGDFSAARNFALSKAEGEWILYLDADERLDKGSKKEIERIIASKDKAGYFCTVKSLDCENNRDNSMRYVRLFRNITGIQFSGKVHEQISASLTENGVKLLNSKILINHLGYNISIEEKRKKASRNLQLLLEEYEGGKSGYFAYQLANTYSILGDAENSLKFYQIASESKELAKSIRADCYMNLALMAHKELDTQKAMQLINNSLELNSEQPFAYLLASKISLQGGNKPKSEEFCRKAYNSNQKTLQNENMGDILIYLDNEEIFWFGLLLAYQNNNRDNFNFYLKECKSHYLSINKRLADSISIIAGKLLAKQGITGSEEEIIFSSLNKNSSEFFYTIIENNSESISNDLIEKIYNKYKPDVRVIKLYSKFYYAHNDIDKAINVLEENREEIINDPSALLYLVSYHLTLGNFNKVEKWIEIIENNFSNVPQITSIIASLKEKILVAKKTKLF